MNATSSHTLCVIGSIIALSVIVACTDVVLPKSDLDIPSGGGQGTTPGSTNVPMLASISVSLSPSAVQVGQKAKATASGADQFGRQFAPGVVAWSTTPEGLATVTEDGIVTAIAEGVATVVASKAGVPPGSASLTISR